MAFDFSTLPKHRAYSYMGKLGDPEGCSIWNPLTYGTCSTWLIRGRTELAEMHNAIIATANAWYAGIQDIQTWPDSEEKSAQLAAAQAGYEEAYSLVQQHSNVQSEYEQAIQPYKNIGLAGLPAGNNGLGNLGVAPIIWAVISVVGLSITALTAWGIANSSSVKAGYESNTAFYNSQAAYNSQCAERLRRGQSCSDLSRPSGTPTAPPKLDIGTLSWVAIAAIGLMAFIAVRNR